MLKGRDVTEGIRIDSVLDTLEQNQTRRFFLQIYRRQHDEYFCFFLLLTTFFWRKLYITVSHYSSKELILFTLTRISNLYMAGENVEAKNFEQSCLRSITDFGDSSKMILW